jgi:drug/metabolite transporter (DMT)-like permease
MTATAKRDALLVLALLSLIWSYNWVVMKQVLQWSGPFEFAAWRGSLGAVVLFALLWARGVPLRPPPLVPMLLIGAAQTLGFQALVQWALVGGGAGKTALLAYTMPFWVVGVAWLVLHQKPTRLQSVAVGIAFAGLLLVLEPWDGLGAYASAALAIGGGLCWAIGTVLSKQLFQRGEATVLSLSAWQMLVGSIGLVVVALLVDEPPVQWTGGFIAALAYNAVLATGLAWILWSWIVDRLPMTVSGLSSLVIPIMGVLFAWAVLGEAPSATEWAGIALIAAALATVALSVAPRGKA